MKLSIERYFNAIDKLNAHLIDGYSDLFNRMFEITFKTEAKTKWDNITRVSEESNFIYIIGRYVLSGQQDEEYVCMVIPIIMLEEERTPYELSEICGKLLQLKTIMDYSAFKELLSDPNITYESITKLIPEIHKEPEAIQTPDPSGELPKPQEVHKPQPTSKDGNRMPDFLKPFNMDELSDEQKEKYKLSKKYD